MKDHSKSLLRNDKIDKTKICRIISAGLLSVDKGKIRYNPGLEIETNEVGYH
jgi:hypothetical protein